MPLALTWSDIAMRLLCASVAGGLIGINRTEHGRAAGLRTSLLVCLAACIAMLQVNSLLPLAGRATDSFVTTDPMRLPLGILSGMGFIGAGAIVRRDNFVVGVTTTATLWFLTVLGLCFGGGQVALGGVGLGLGLLVLAGLKFFESRMKQDREARLLIVTKALGPDEDEIRAILKNDGFFISACAYQTAADSEYREWNCELRWRATPHENQLPQAVRILTAREGVVRIAWMPQPV